MRLHLVRVTVLAVAALGLAACGGGDTGRISLGGTVDGLRGSGLAVAVNGGTPTALTADGAFTLPVTIAVGGTYHVSVVAQPTAPSQTCVIANGDGQAGARDISSIAVTCSTDRFTVGGSLVGLIGSGLVLQNNGVDDLRVSTDGSFAFATAVASGAAYDVTVLAQPTDPPEICDVTRASGVIGAAAVDDVLVSCDARIQPVAGTVQGLTGTGIVLRNNGADDLVIASDGAFKFTTTMAPGDEYLVTVEQQPADPGRHCSVSNGVGTVGPVGVSDIRVQCRSVGRWIYVSTTETIVFAAEEGTFMFSWDPATDRFQLLAGSPIPHAVRVAVAPDGTFAYVHLWRWFAADNRLAAYVIDQSTGALVQVPGAAPLPLDATLADAAIDPSSRYLYYVQYWDDRVFAYAVNATGTITAVPGGRAGDFRDDRGKLAFDPQGRFLFVANRANRTISAFGIDPDSGALIEFSGSPYALEFAPEDLDVEPQGRYLYVTSSSKGLVPYVIDGFDGSTGALRPASVAPYTPAGYVAGRYGFDPNSNRIIHIDWCGIRDWDGWCRPSGIVVPWGLRRLAADETGAVRPLGDEEFFSYQGEFTTYDSPRFDSSGKFACFQYTMLQEGGSLVCRLVDATTGALGQPILGWTYLEQGAKVNSFVIVN